MKWNFYRKTQVPKTRLESYSSSKKKKEKKNNTFVELFYNLKQNKPTYTSFFLLSFFLFVKAFGYDVLCDLGSNKSLNASSIDGLSDGLLLVQSKATSKTDLIVISS